MIDDDSVNVSFTLMENYYGLLREKFPSKESDVTIPNLQAVRCIYQVSDIFHALPVIDQSFTDNLFCDMLQESEVTTIQASLRTKKIMMFPFFYIPDKHFYWL